MYDVFIGKQRSLVFPIMCNAHVSIPYASNIPDIGSSGTSDDVPYGLWAHTDSFTFEAIFTPYDINGMGATGLRGRTAQQTSDYVMPQGGTGKLSEEYLPVADRYGHEMCLFHNDNFRVTLLNSTTTNNNQPAEYKVKVYLTINSNQDTFVTDTLITSASSKAWTFGDDHVNNNLSGFDSDGRIIYDSVARLTNTHTIGSTLAVNTTEDHNSRALTDIFFDGQKVYKRDGFTFSEVGTIATSGVSSSNLTFTSSVNAMLDETELYIETFREPKYVENMHHLAVVYSAVNNSIKVFFNRRLVLNSTHTETSAFEFSRTDFIIGKNTTGDNDASTDMQFMGELHEMSIEGFEKNTFTITNSLYPFFDETLLYLRFEEVDE